MGDAHAATDGNGSAQKSFRTIQQAARIAATRLAGCEMKAAKIEAAPGGGLLVQKILKAGDGHAFALTETFSPTSTGICWEITILDTAPAWSTEIETHWGYPAGPDVTYRTAWGNPQGETIAGLYDNEEVANAIIRPLTPDRASQKGPARPERPPQARLRDGQPAQSPRLGNRSPLIGN